MKLNWLTVDGVNISWDNGVVDAPQEFLDSVDFLVDAKVRVRSPRFYFAEEVAGMDTMVGALLTVEFLLDVLGVGLVEAPMPFGESDVFVTDNYDVFDGSGEFEKAMSRSEAGRYAAEQRWKNHAKQGDAVRVLDPRYQKVADRINAGLQSLTEAGFQIGDIKSEEDHLRFRDMYVKFNDFFEQQTELWRETNGEQGKQFPPMTYMGLRMMGRILTIVPDVPSKNNRTIVVHDESLVAGVAMAHIYNNNKTKLKTMSIEFMGSAQLVKGVGSAMYGELLKWGVSQGVEAVELEPLDGAKSFWRGEMGMIWDGKNMIYADGKIGMIGALK